MKVTEVEEIYELPSQFPRWWDYPSGKRKKKDSSSNFEDTLKKILDLNEKIKGG